MVDDGALAGFEQAKSTESRKFHEAKPTKKIGIVFPPPERGTAYVVFLHRPRDIILMWHVSDSAQYEVSRGSRILSIIHRCWMRLCDWTQLHTTSILGSRFVD